MPGFLGSGVGSLGQEVQVGLPNRYGICAVNKGPAKVRFAYQKALRTVTPSSLHSQKGAAIVIAW